MNWTGGSLQRHSKANANALVKKQKQHFAKARLQPRSHRSCPLSPAFSINRAPQPIFPPKTQQFSQRACGSRHVADGFDREDDRPICGRQPFGMKILRSLDKRVKIQASDDEGVFRQGNNEFTDQSYANHVSSQSRDATGFEHARKALLDKSDWVGLATARPVRFNQETRDKMEGLARRRKIAKPEQRTSMPRKNSSRRALRSMQPTQWVPSLRAEETSLRVEPNIHQTKTIPTIPDRKESIQTAARAIDDSVRSGEAWDEQEIKHTRRQTSIRRTSGKSQAHACEPTKGRTAGLDSTDGHHLITLDEAVGLGLTSWEKVRGHARSRTQTSASVGNPPSSRTFPKPTGTRVDAQQDNAFAILGGSHQNPLLPAPSPAMPGIIQRVIAVGLVEDGLGQISGPPLFPTPDLHPSHPPRPSQTSCSIDKSIHQAPSIAYDVAFGAEMGLHSQFTLEDQVKLEQAVEDLERRKQQRREPSLFADNTGQSDAVVPLRCPDNISTSTVGAGADIASPRHASTFSSNEIASHILHHPSTGISGDPSNCITRKQKSRVEEIADYISGETEYFFPSDSVEERAPRLIDPSPRVPFTSRGRQQVDQTIASKRTITSKPPQNVDMDDEARMRYVFPEEFGHIQDGFRFEVGQLLPQPTMDWPAAISAIRKPSYARHGISSVSSGPEQRGSAPGPFELPESIPTTVNTSIFMPSPLNRDHSETDFLSQFSPMEGHFDERLVDISLYNNAPKTKPELDTSSAGRSQKFRYPETKALPRSLVPAKRRAPDPLGGRASSCWSRSTDHASLKSLPPPHSPQSLWSLSNTTDAIQGSTGTAIPGRSDATRSPQATISEFGVNRFLDPQALVHDNSKKGECGLGTVASQEESPASIFTRSDELTVDALPSRSCRITGSMASDHALTASFQLWSDESMAASTGLASLEPVDTPPSALVPPMALSKGRSTDNPIVNIHAPLTRDFGRETTQFSTQIPLWGES